MKRGGILGAIAIAAFAASAYWVVRTTEPSRRYDRIRSLMAARHGQPSSAWSEVDRRAFWESIDWLGDRKPELLTKRLSRSIASDDPLEREGAIVLIDMLLVNRLILFPAIPEAPDVLPYPPRMSQSPGSAFDLEKIFVGKSDALVRLSRDESPSTRISLVRIAQQIVNDDLDAAILRMCREDPDLSIRMHAVDAIAWHSLDAAGLRAFRDLLTTDDAALRLVVAAALADSDDAEGLRELLRATETDSPAKAVKLLKGKIPERLLERLLRKYP